MLQDGALNQAPVITTYKTVNKTPVADREPQKASSSESVPSKQDERRNRTLASLKNIKRLSTSEDYVSLAPSSRLVNTVTSLQDFCSDPNQKCSRKKHVVFKHIMKTHLFKYIENFTTKKGKFSDKKF